MKIISFLICSFLFSTFLQARMKNPANYPQLTWFFQQTLKRTLDYSFDMEETSSKYNEETGNYSEQVKGKSSVKGNLVVDGGWGAGFSMEVPHRRWLTFGFLLGFYGNSPEGSIGGVFKYKGGRLSTRVQFFSRFQYPVKAGSFTLNPNIKTSVGFGGGFTALEYLKETNTGLPSAPFGFPMGVALGTDIYWGKWFAFTIGAQYLIEPSVDFLIPIVTKYMGKRVKETVTLMGTELAIVFGIKSTYL